MSHLKKTWNLETKVEHLTYLARNVRMETGTAPLYGPLADFLQDANACLEERRQLRLEQLDALARVNSIDRRLDILAASLSHAARQAVRMNPALRLLGTLFPEGVTAVTRYRGHGVETQARLLSGIVQTVQNLPEAAEILPAAEALLPPLAEAESAIAALAEADRRMEENERRYDELSERAWNVFHAVRGELVKMYANDRRFIDTFFLN